LDLGVACAHELVAGFPFVVPLPALGRRLLADVAGRVFFFAGQHFLVRQGWRPVGKIFVVVVVFLFAQDFLVFVRFFSLVFSQRCHKFSFTHGDFVVFFFAFFVHGLQVYALLLHQLVALESTTANEQR